MNPLGIIIATSSVMNQFVVTKRNENQKHLKYFEDIHTFMY